MKASMLAEYRKFITTRMWWILAASMVAYLAVIGLMLAGIFIFTPEVEMGSAPVSGLGLASTIYSLANSVGYPFALVVGTLAVTGEFRHKTITGTLLANPSRTTLTVSKMIASIPIGLFYGIAGVGGMVLVTAPLLEFAGDGAFLGNQDVLEVLGFSVLALALWTMVGVGFGLIVPNQIASVIIIIGFTQLVEPIARLAFAFVESLTGVAKFFPGAAADSLVGAGSFITLGTGVSEEALTRLEGGLVLLAYAVVFALIGRLTTLRRDIS